LAFYFFYREAASLINFVIEALQGDKKNKKPRKQVAKNISHDVNEL